MMLRWLFIVMALATAASAKADSLKHDPFARPLLAAMSTSSKPVTSNSTAVTATAEEESAWSAQLSAVMVAGRNSLVNVDGTLMRIGEELDGYRLVQVRDSEAVFYKDKKRVVLRMEISTKKDSKVRGGL